MMWNVCRIDDLGDINRGKSKHRPRNDARLFGGKYPFIQTGDVKKANLYITEFDTTYSEFGLAQSRLWPKDTLCITIAANIAESAILGFDACFPDSVVGFVPKKNKADLKFVKYLLDEFKVYMQQISKGTTQDNLSLDKLRRVKFYAPDYDVQVKIAKVISAYDDLIENNNRRIKILEQMAENLYKEWFVRFRFPGHEQVEFENGMPKGWEYKTIEELSDTLRRGISPTYDSDGKYTVINQKCIRSSILDMSEAQQQSKPYKSELNLQDGDTVICSTGTGTLGRVGQVYGEYKDTTYDSHVTLVRANQVVGRHFLYWSLKELQPWFMNMGIGSTNQQELYRGTIKNAKILVPSNVDLLDAFENYIQDIHCQIGLLRDKNQNLTKQRDKLLPRLMSGKLEV